MKSEEINAVLSTVKGANITDKNCSTVLKKIRSDAMATKGGVRRLVKQGCVPSILKLLYHYVSSDKEECEAERNISESNVNTALSIVANLLMEREARQQVKRDGMETIVGLLEKCSSEEVKIRCCRSLSNLAMDAAAWPNMAKAKAAPALTQVLDVRYVEVHKPSDQEENSGRGDKTPPVPADSEMEVDIEMRFPSVGLVEAACKVLRYVIADRSVCHQLVEEGVVKRLAMLMKSENDKLVAFVVRTLSELWTKMNKRITETMASEFARAGVMSKVVSLVDSEDDKLSQQSFSLLLPLAAHAKAAAQIGSSGGVDFCLSHLNSTRRHIPHRDVVSLMCLLAKEAVNRVKLRESKGLGVFLDTLRDDAMYEVHDRVVSCLVSFLYDDLSLTVLLDRGLVSLLLSQLQRCGNFVSDFDDVNVLKSVKALLDKSAPPTSTPPAAASTSVKDDDDNNASVSADHVFKSTPALLSNPQVSTSSISSPLVTSDHSVEEKSVNEFSGNKLPGKLSQLQLGFGKRSQSEPSINTMVLYDERATTATGKRCEGHEEEDVRVPKRPKLKDNGPLEALYRNQDQSDAGCMAPGETGFKDKDEEGCNDETEEGFKDEAQDGDKYQAEGEGEGECLQPQRYSMHSPSYQAESSWSMEHYKPGVTCKSFHLHQHEALSMPLSLPPRSPQGGSSTGQSEDCRFSTSSFLSSPYSPLSMTSYCSPSHPDSSSPPHGPSSLTSSPPHIQLSPAHSPCFYEGCASPRSSSDRSSPAPQSPHPHIHTPISTFHHPSHLLLRAFPNSAVHGLVFSSSEEDDDDSDDDDDDGHDEKDHKQARDECANNDNDDDNKNDNQPKYDSGGYDSSGFTIENNSKEMHLNREVMFYLREDNKTAGTSTELPMMTTDSIGEEEDWGNACEDLNPAQSISNTALAQTNEELGKRFFRPAEKLDSNDEPAAKRRKLDNDDDPGRAPMKAGPHALVTQNNILILLSRLSVRDDLSQHLASTPVVSCLTDHLALATQPHDRCVRVLSRIVASPHCLPKLLRMCAPALLVKALLLDPDMRLVSPDNISHIHQSSGSSSSSSGGGGVSMLLRQLPLSKMQSSEITALFNGTISTTQKTQRTQSTDAARKSLTSSMKASKKSTSSLSEATTPSTTPHNTKSDANLLEQNSSPSPDQPGSSVSSLSRQTSWDSRSSQSNKLGTSSVVGGVRGWEKRALAGGKLLEDFASQAQSPHGEGVILHMLGSSSAPDRLMCAASVLFLQHYWVRQKRQKLLLQRDAVDRVLWGLCGSGSPSSPSPSPPSPSPPSCDADADHVAKDVLALAVLFLAHSLNIPPRFQPSDVAQELRSALDSMSRAPQDDEEEKEDDPALEQESGEDQHMEVLVEAEAETETELCRYLQADKDLRLVVVCEASSRGRTETEVVLLACRTTLVSNSSVFGVMLQGGYAESSQSRVMVSDVCWQGMYTLMHYLHGCDLRCPHIKALGSFGCWLDLTLTQSQSQSLDGGGAGGGGRGVGRSGKRRSSSQMSSGQAQGLTSPSPTTTSPAPGSKRKQWLKHLLSVMAVADQYLLPDLLRYLSCVVSTACLLDNNTDPHPHPAVDDSSSSSSVDRALRVFHFAVLHGLSDLAEDCVRVLLLSCSSASASSSSSLSSSFSSSSSSSTVVEMCGILSSLAEGPSTGCAFRTAVLALVKRGIANTP